MGAQHSSKPWLSPAALPSLPPAFPQPTVGRDPDSIEPLGDLWAHRPPAVPPRHSHGAPLCRSQCQQLDLPAQDPGPPRPLGGEAPTLGCRTHCPNLPPFPLAQPGWAPSRALTATSLPHPHPHLAGGGDPGRGDPGHPLLLPAGGQVLPHPVRPAGHLCLHG